MLRQTPLPPPAAYLIARLRAAVTRRSGDTGVTTLETVIWAVSLALLAFAAVAVITGKVHAWLAQIPS